MNGILATEPAPAATDEKRSTLPPLETWAANERMRHVPTPEWMARKIETDLRRRVEILMPVFVSLPGADLRALCRSLERLADAAKPTARQNGHDLPQRIDALLTVAATNVRSLETTPM